MKKIGKIIVGLTAVAAVVGGCALIMKKVVDIKKEDDFWDDEDDFENDNNFGELDESKDEKDYINISSVKTEEVTKKTDSLENIDSKNDTEEK